MLERESVVYLDRRWYVGEEGRVRPVEENVEVGQICEAERGGVRRRGHVGVSIWHSLKVDLHAGWVRALMGDDDRAQSGIPPDVT